jgi:hypothetical protein
MMINPEKPQSESLELHAKRLVELEQRVASMQADLKSQEDLLAWVVDLLEAVQSNALINPEAQSRLERLLRCVRVPGRNCY